MAKFGLSDSDSSDEDYDTSQDGQQHHRASTSASPRPSASSSQTLEQDDGDQDDAPPPSSSLNDEQGMDEHDEEDQLPGQRARARRSTRETSFLSTTSISSRPHHDDDDDDDDDDDARSTSTASLTPRKRPVPASRTLPTTATATNKTWSTNLRLEPKRVAVMQASFFQQQASPVAAEQQAPTKKDHSTWTIRGSAAAASTPPKATTASTFKAAPAPAPALAPSPSVVPTPAIDPSPFRPYRKYTRVPLDRSITKGKEGNLVDLGLALGRSFRVGWSPTGQIVHLGRGKLYRGENVDKSDALKVDRLKTSSSTDMRSAVRLLEVQLVHTPIYSNPVDSSNDDPSSSIPFAVPHPELRFTHFVNEFPSSDRSAEANLWRLGQALFDEIQDLAIPENVVVDDPSVQAYVERLRRTDRFERWLREVVRGEVEDDLRNVGGDGLGASSEEADEAKRIFALLSGHQVERACQAAVQAGDLRLATLLAQAGGDDEFRRDMFLQLVKWREYRVDSHILPEYRKIYELLCGNVGLSEGRTGKDGDSVVDGVEEVHVAQGLGWKRAFGLSLWYATFRSSIETAMESYESAFQEDPRVAKPEPEYIATPTRSPEKRPEWSNRSGETPSDPLYQLLKLYTLSTHPLEQVLLPINFGTCPLDYRLPWHLYILLSRVLRRRDFEDRVQVVDFEDRGMDDGDDGRGFLEGNSVRADLMTEAYANQLEMNGEWTWSAFVLLHLELPIARAKALQALLSRSTHLLTSDTFTFLTEKLRIPFEWIYHAQALAAPDRFEKFGLHLLAREWNEAHRLLKEQLGPEAVLRGDLGLLRRLGGRFEEEQGWRKVEGWEEGAGLLKEYAEVVEGEKRWLERVREGAHAEEAELEERGRKVRSLLETIARLGDEDVRSRKTKIARDEMMSRLTLIATRVNGALNKIQPKMLQESDRLVWIRGAADSFLTQSLQAACS
ncbi:BZ3500_MvSof-1268-A1-R1_Chr3-2g06294 [Microbotryum saponariae]|uniref:BZ3500_MvSof-1268-A1-R1_Chr3-2g06294 protein n=1 Tax=Microbotryum saponariae TaxID=289078 RepID=A0A2X0LHC2_9BASI|nr:BZ3500_MvSof-1268-A1-R1_Chr3-2g06294 [Microbotryum saponariae]SDA04265.1 BZ3501_MvSof-1269-A2-R1_Chr3-2g05985 [Microbotryum saponariae]